MKSARSRVIIIAVVAVLMAACVVAYVSFVSPGGGNEITLPGPGSADASQPQGDALPEGFTGVTRDNVQRIAAVMTRAESSYRVMSIRTAWSGGGVEDMVEMVCAGELARINVTHLGETRYTLLTEDECMIWYPGDAAYFSCPRGDFSSLSQARIPDYTDILTLRKNQITDAFLEEYSGSMCIRVEFSDGGFSKIYWLDLNTGLLSAAQEWREDELVYEMILTAVEAPVTSSETLTEAFTLPDGTLLYQ